MEQLDPQTREQYALFFAAADTDQDGQIGQEDAKSFYTKSGLGTDTLARIWQQVRVRGGAGGPDALDQPK